MPPPTPFRPRSAPVLFQQEIEGVCLYEAYQARFASMPAGGRADGPLYYSYEVGPAHVIVLASFFVYSSGSAQYNWLQADLAKVDRTKTPWLLVIIHAPWYNSNSAHQCVLMRLRCSAGRRSRPRAPPPAHPLPCPPGATASSCARRSSRCCTRPR